GAACKGCRRQRSPTFPENSTARAPGFEKVLLAAILRCLKSRTQMSKSKSTPMTREVVSRVTKAMTPLYGGQIPGSSFISRIDAEVQKEAARQAKAKANG
ncbi:hypothetical protein, partial [Polaromonas sp.]|uniref:hypothetical protein n=1 Tax=Polaromonas sp. TaxID=1869339 RepID=UPI0025D14115